MSRLSFFIAYIMFLTVEAGIFPRSTEAMLFRDETTERISVVIYVLRHVSFEGLRMFALRFYVSIPEGGSSNKSLFVNFPQFMY